MTDPKAYDRMTEMELLEHVKPFLERTVSAGRSGIEQGVAMQAAAVACEKGLLESNTTARAALHAINGRLAAVNAPRQIAELERPAGTVGNPARVLSILLLAGLASFGVAAGYPHTSEGRAHVTAIDTRSASTAILAGKAAMQAKDYRAAVEHFQDAGTRGAVPEAWLPGMIECRLAAGQFGLAESLCAELANANPRNQSLVPYFRGACLYGQGLKDAARSEYAEANKLGHPGAADALRKLGAN